MAKTIRRLIILAGLGCWRTTQWGCSHEVTPVKFTLPDSRASRPISSQAAAQLAAKLANDACDAKYHKRPFTSGQHQATFEAGKYSWGGLDVGGPDGFSALVTFREDGSEPHAEIYFSSDRLSARK